jgi:ribosomal protein S18 acetylase RimI-like enzyme
MRFSDLDLGWRSHLLATQGGDQIERDDCIVLRSPANPGYYWGNCLIVPTVADDQVAHWLARFEEEIPPRPPASRHVAIGVNAPMSPAQALPAWRAAGFEVLRNTVLRIEPAGLVAAGAPPAGVTLRALRLPDEVELAADAQAADNDDGHEPVGYREFRLRTMQHAAAMHAQGQAHWFGVFAGDALVADCGLVYDASLGRFQHVHTLPPWRRRGLCGALVQHVCRYAFDRLAQPKLVMCADPDDIAIGIYRAQGFAPVGEHALLQRRPPQDRA